MIFQPINKADANLLDFLILADAKTLESKNTLRLYLPGYIKSGPVLDLVCRRKLRNKIQTEGFNLSHTLGINVKIKAAVTISYRPFPKSDRLFGFDWCFSSCHRIKN